MVLISKLLIIPKVIKTPGNQRRYVQPYLYISLHDNNINCSSDYQPLWENSGGSWTSPEANLQLAQLQ